MTFHSRWGKRDGTVAGSRQHPLPACLPSTASLPSVLCAPTYADSKSNVAAGGDGTAGEEAAADGVQLQAMRRWDHRHHQQAGSGNSVI